MQLAQCWIFCEYTADRYAGHLGCKAGDEPVGITLFSNGLHIPCAEGQGTIVMTQQS